MTNCIDDFKEAFIKGSFVIDCDEIRLTQNDSETPIVYTSRGYLEASPEHGIKARLICQRDPSDIYKPLAKLMNCSDLRSGVLIPDSHYYLLEARDITGNAWIHPAVDLKKDDGPTVVILTFNCSFIQTKSVLDGVRPYTQLVFLDMLEFPVNVIKTTTVKYDGQPRSSATSKDGSKGIVAGMDVRYEMRNNTPGEKYSEFFARAQIGTFVPKDFESRLLEAIRFCTATMAKPVMSETLVDNFKVIELSKSRSLNNNSIVHAPISCLEPNSAKDFYNLFECYFNYSCANTKEKDFAPISSKLGGLFALKDVWADTIVLLLCVAVEAVLGEDKFKGIAKQKAGLTDDINRLIDTVNQTLVDKSLITRAVNAISNMKSSSAADRLHALIQVGAVEEEDRLAWKRRRNMSAHGNFVIDTKKTQQVLDDMFRLTTLTYKLVFLLIGYSGKYSNRAVPGWRDDDFDAQTYWAELEKNASLGKVRSPTC